jgi:hypothetical protein
MFLHHRGLLVELKMKIISQLQFDLSRQYRFYRAMQ